MFDNIDESIIDAIIKSFNQYHNLYQETRNDFIHARLQDLIATEGEEKSGENIYTNYIDTVVVYIRVFWATLDRT